MREKLGLEKAIYVLLEKENSRGTSIATLKNFICIIIFSLDVFCSDVCFAYFLEGRDISPLCRESIRQVRTLHPTSRIYLIADRFLSKQIKKERVFFKEGVLPVNSDILPFRYPSWKNRAEKKMLFLEAFMRLNHECNVVLLDENQLVFQSLSYLPAQRMSMVHSTNDSMSLCFAPDADMVSEVIDGLRRGDARSICPRFPSDNVPHEKYQNGQVLFDAGDLIDSYLYNDVYTHRGRWPSGVLKFERDSQGLKQYYLQNNDQKYYLANLAVTMQNYKIVKMHEYFAKRAYFPVAEPFLSGDTFRSLATKYYDQGGCCRAHEIGLGDVVFIAGDFVESFIGKVLPFVENKFVVIIHNSDESADQRIMPLLNSAYVQKVYAQNLTLQHPKACHIPIGIANDKYSFSNKSILETIISYAPERDLKLRTMLITFFRTTPPTNRNFIFNKLSQQKNTCVLKRCRPDKYLATMSDYLFIPSPVGRGLDCYRTWEALYLGSIPIVERNALSPLYKDLPCIEIDSWDDLTDAFLEKEYQKILRNTYDYSKLYLPYWEKRVEESREECIHQ